MDIGEIVRIRIVTPLESPVPLPAPEVEQRPVTAPRPEPAR